jgi:hypothetical protein
VIDLTQPWSVITGDCLDILKQLPDGCVDAVVTDPPYGTGAYDTDVDVVSPELFAELRRVSPFVAMFGWPETLVGWCIRFGVPPDEWITWWPTNGRCRGRGFRGLWRETECVAVWGTGRWREMTQPRSPSAVRIARKEYDAHRSLKTWRGDVTRLGDVWRDTAPGLAFNHKRRQHPNEKSVPFVSRLLGATPDGCTVLDPFCGSGTTGVACQITGRKFIGIEIDPTYADIARRRIAEAVPLGATA